MFVHLHRKSFKIELKGMPHLIDKDALVAEIQKRRSKHFKSGGSPSSEYCHEDDEILCIINTLEVKKVDLEK